jgi:prolyl oligopeptidase
VPAYPSADRVDAVDVLTGPDGPVAVPDPYRWLEDAGSPQTEAWLQAQEALLHQHRATWPHRERLRARVEQLLGAGTVGAPVWRGERAFFVRREPGQEHAVLMTTEPDGTERVLVDPMALDASGLTTLDAWQPSREGLLLAYQLSEGGREESVLRVLDLTTGAVVDGPVDRARYSPVAWLPGGERYYYVRRLDPALLPTDEQQFHRRVYLHRVGSDPATDNEIFGAGRDPRTYYGCSVSRDGRWLAISASVGTEPRDDVWLADLHAAPPEAPRLATVQEGVDARTALHVGRDGRLYVWTDRDAPRGRLCVADPVRPDATGWTDLVPEDPEAVLDDYAILDGPDLAAPVLLVSWTRHSLGEISVHGLADGARTASVPVPGPGTVGGLVERPEGGHEAWFGWTDPTTPAAVYRYDARAHRLALWAEAPGQVSVPRVHVAQHVYSSADGTPIRALVVAPTEVPDRPRPTILYGYGGFGVSLTPGYSAGVLAWVEAGGVYAIASLRGGGEEGEGWHRAGMLGAKQNVFDDFHAAAHWLLDTGWTAPGRLGISGGSNGGLLVGVALTQRPDLYRSVVCSAPLLDMVRYERFGLGATWNVEYGRADVPEELGWLLGYSPYHHVRPGTEYPAVLFTTFDGDTRVDPLHARKMCAALQAATAGDPRERPVLLRAERDVGHGGRALSRSIEQVADTLAFQAAALGLPLP